MNMVFADRTGGRATAAVKLIAENVASCDGMRRGDCGGARATCNDATPQGNGVGAASGRSAIPREGHIRLIRVAVHAEGYATAGSRAEAHREVRVVNRYRSAVSGRH